MRIEPPCQEFKEAEAGGSVQTTSSQSYRRLAERRGGRPAARRRSGHRLRLHASLIGELLRPAWSGSNGRDPNGAAVFVVNSTTPPHLGSLPLSTRDLRGPSIHIHITLMWGLGWTLPALDHRAGEAAAAPLYRARGEASGHNHTPSDLR